MGGGACPRPSFFFSLYYSKPHADNVYMKHATQTLLVKTLGQSLALAQANPVHLTLKGEAPVKATVQEMLASLEATYGKKG